MLKRIPRLLVAFALICAVGGHWAILQSVAWVSMVAAYSQEGGVQAAIVKTFSGKAPCQLCKIVKEGKKSEQEHEQQQLLVKLDLFSEPPQSLFQAPPFEPVLSPGARHALAWADAPPVPPPLAG